MVAVVLWLLVVNRLHDRFDFHSHHIPQFQLGIDHSFAAVAGKMNHCQALRPEMDATLELGPCRAEATLSSYRCRAKGHKTSGEEFFLLADNLFPNAPAGLTLRPRVVPRKASRNATEGVPYTVGNCQSTSSAASP